MPLPYRVQFSPEAEEHLLFLTVRLQRIVIDAIAQQLTYQPTVETRNRKRMRSNPLASWELRVDNLRVYYDVLDETESEPPAMVVVRAVGVKEGNRVFIGGEEVEL